MGLAQAILLAGVLGAGSACTAAGSHEPLPDAPVAKRKAPVALAPATTRLEALDDSLDPVKARFNDAHDKPRLLLRLTAT